MAREKFFVLQVDETIVLPFEVMLDKSRQLHIPGCVHVGIACLTGPLITVVSSRAGANVSKAIITGRMTYLLYR